MDVTTLIQIAIGGLLSIFGLHQIFKPQEWIDFIPRRIRAILPVHQLTFIKFHTLINIGLGILFGFGIGMPAVAWITLVWFASIIIASFRVDWAVALRDLTLAVMIIVYLMIL